MYTQRNVLSNSFQIGRNTIVVTVSILIMNQTEMRWVHQKGTQRTIGFKIRRKAATTIVFLSILKESDKTFLCVYTKRRKSSQKRDGRVGPGRVGSGRVGSGRVGPGRVGPGRAGSSRFIILNDSAGPKMVIHLYLTFLRFF